MTLKCQKMATRAVGGEGLQTDSGKGGRQRDIWKKDWETECVTKKRIVSR